MAHVPFRPLDLEASVYEGGLQSHKPPFTFHSGEWEKQALPILSESARGYVSGNAGAGSTYRKNIAAFDKYSIVPSRLRPSRTDKDGKPVYSDPSTTVIGHKLDFPFALAPIGVLKIFNRQGEPAVAKAAASVGIPYTLSTATSTSIEDVAEAHGQGATRWYQLYWPGNEYNDITISLLNRAKKNGYTALFVTLDTYVLGWRPSDMDHGYNPFIHADRIGVEIGLSDPVFQKKFKEKYGYDIDESERHRGWDVEAGSLGEAAREWTHVGFSGHSHSWEDIAFLKKHWDGPIVLKGIQTIEDAKKSVEVGVQGIVVSNHGGRQQDGGNASLAVLPRIAAAVGDKLDIFFDSGVRSGADALKAIALGAKCVLIGRPYVYGLTLGGEEGVRHVLKCLCGELVLNMHLAGLRGIDEVNKDCLVKDDDLW